MQRFGFKCRKIVTWNSDGVLRRLLAPLHCSEEFSLRLHFSKPLNLNLFSIIHFELNSNAHIQKEITGRDGSKGFFLFVGRGQMPILDRSPSNSAHGTVCCTSMIMYFVRSILNFLSWILVFQKHAIYHGLTHYVFMVIVIGIYFIFSLIFVLRPPTKDVMLL